MGGACTTQNPAEEQQAYCNMLQENNCWRESWLLEEQAQHRIPMREQHIFSIVTCYERSNVKREYWLWEEQIKHKILLKNNMHIVTITTCYERTNTKENLELWEEQTKKTESCWRTTCIL